VLAGNAVVNAKLHRLHSDVSVADFFGEVFHAKPADAQIVTMKYRQAPTTVAFANTGYEPHADVGSIRVDDGGNNYFSIASFVPGFADRTKDYVHGMHVLLLDDPGSKGDAAGVAARLGTPTYKVQTSKSDQWGYVFDQPVSVEDGDELNGAIRVLGLGDKNGNFCHRFGRSPFGINTKPEANKHRVRLTEWKPGHRLTLAAARAALLGDGGERGTQHAHAVGTAFDPAVAIQEILSADAFHDNLIRLAAHYVRLGEKRDTIIAMLQGLMMAAKPNSKADRWQDRYNAISKSVDSAIAKGYGHGAREHTVAIAAGEIPEAVHKLVPLLAALPAQGTYQYAGRLMTPYLARRPGARGPDGMPSDVDVLTMSAVTLAAFSTQIDSLAKFTAAKFRDGKRYDVRVDVPERVARTLFESPKTWGAIPTITHISEVPLLIGGKLVATPGYNSGVWINAPAITLPALTKGNALQALARVQAWIEEFPFADDQNRAVAVAVLLLAVLRPSMACAPGVIVSKPNYGSGASFFVDLASVVHTGRRAPVLSLTTDQPENRKIIEGELHSGVSFLNLDNLPDGVPFESTLIAQVLSAASGKVRVLGKNKGSPEVSFNRFVILNGNNVIVAKDLARRFITLRIDPRMSNPEERKFKRPTLLDDAAQERAALLADLFTLAAAYQASGERVNVNALAGYEEFCRLIAEPVMWLTGHDIIASVSTKSAPDETAQILGDLLPLWQRMQGNTNAPRGITVNQALKALRELDPDTSSECEMLLAQACGIRRFNHAYDLDPRTIGHFLTRVEGRVVDGKRFERDGILHKVVRWRAVDVAVGVGGSDGLSGLVLSRTTGNETKGVGVSVAGTTRNNPPQPVIPPPRNSGKSAPTRTKGARNGH
jgi:hypothetical protein